VSFDLFGLSITVALSLVRSVAAIWLGGISVLILIRLAAVVGFRRRLGKSTLPTDEGLVAAEAACAAELKLRQIPAVITTTLVSSPALCGLFRPKLLFPPGLGLRLDRAELRFVVLHELGHLRRKDLWTQALLQAAAILHWFNPAVWWALGMARLDCELACDEFVLHRVRSDGDSDYGRTLLKVLGALSGKARLSATVGIAESKRQLVTRIAMIADYRPRTHGRTLAGLALVLGCAVLGYSEQAKPPAATLPAESTGSSRGEAAVTATARARTTWAEREAETKIWIERGTVILRAIGSPGGVEVAMFDVNGEPKLVVEDSGLAAATVREIDKVNGRVRVEFRDKTAHEFDLKKARKVDFPEVAAPNFDLVAVPGAERSLEREQVPSQVVLSWPKINAEGKEAILLNYLRGGLVVSVDMTSTGGSVESSRLFAEKIRQKAAERREIFVAGLSPQQREQACGGTRMAVSLTAPAAEQKQKAALDQVAAADQEKIVAELNAEQRKFYDLWRATQAL